MRSATPVIPARRACRALLPSLPCLAFRLDDDQETAAIDLLAPLDAHLRHTAGSDSRHVVLHLHGFEADERLAGGDLIAWSDADGHHAARHGRGVGAAHLL